MIHTCVFRGSAADPDAVPAGDRNAADAGRQRNSDRDGRCEQRDGNSRADRRPAAQVHAAAVVFHGHRSKVVAVHRFSNGLRGRLTRTRHGTCMTRARTVSPSSSPPSPNCVPSKTCTHLALSPRVSTHPIFVRRRPKTRGLGFCTGFHATRRDGISALEICIYFRERSIMKRVRACRGSSFEFRFFFFFLTTDDCEFSIRRNKKPIATGDGFRRRITVGITTNCVVTKTAVTCSV